MRNTRSVGRTGEAPRSVHMSTISNNDNNNLRPFSGNNSSANVRMCFLLALYNNMLYTVIDLMTRLQSMTTHFSMLLIHLLVHSSGKTGSYITKQRYYRWGIVDLFSNVYTN